MIDNPGLRANRNLRVESQIFIDAPPALVWSVTVGIAEWPRWCPTVRQVHGLTGDPPATGTRFRLKQPLQRERLWQVSLISPPVRAGWETVDAGPRFCALHEMIPQNGGTLSRLSLVAPRPRGFFSCAALTLAAALAVENRALRRRCWRLSDTRRRAS